MICKECGYNSVGVYDRCLDCDKEFLKGEEK